MSVTIVVLFSIELLYLLIVKLKKESYNFISFEYHFFLKGKFTIGKLMNDLFLKFYYISLENFISNIVLTDGYNLLSCLFLWNPVKWRTL